MTITLAATEVSKASFITILVKNQNDLGHELLVPYQKILSQKIGDKDNGVTVFYESGRVITVVVLRENATGDLGVMMEEARIKGGHICKRINYEKSSQVVILRSGDSVSKEEMLSFTEGVALANYQFIKYKSDKKFNALTNITVLDKEITANEIAELEIVVEANKIARDLGNEPVVSLNSVQLGEAVLEMSHNIGFKAEILNKTQIEALRMGGLLGVNAGSSTSYFFNFGI